MSLGDVVDELLNEHSLADTGTSEETDLATTSIGSEEVDDLDTGLKDFSSGGLLDEGRRVGVDGEPLVRLDGATFVNGLTNDVHDTAECALADGDENGGTGVEDLLATDETLCTVHCNGADGVLSQVGGDFKDESAAVEVLDLESVENRGEVLGLELDIDDSSDDGLD